MKIGITLSRLFRGINESRLFRGITASHDDITTVFIRLQQLRNQNHMKLFVKILKLVK